MIDQENHVSSLFGKPISTVFNLLRDPPQCDCDKVFGTPLLHVNTSHSQRILIWICHTINVPKLSLVPNSIFAFTSAMERSQEDNSTSKETKGPVHLLKYLCGLFFVLFYEQLYRIFFTLTFCYYSW